MPISAAAVAAATGAAMQEGANLYDVVQAAIYGASKGDRIGRQTADTLAGASVETRIRWARIRIITYVHRCADSFYSLSTCCHTDTGMIGNAAAVAAAYGMEVYLMDTINRSESTELILEDCRNAGIRTEMIRFDSSLPDVKCLIFLKDGERIVYVIPTEKKDIVPKKVSPAPVVSTGRTGYAYFLHLLPSGK